MRFNDGAADDPQVPPYDRFEMCWGAHTCHMGVLKALKGLSAFPVEKRTKETCDTIKKAAEFMLIHHIYKCSRNLKRTSKPGWLKFGYPLMYRTDIPEIPDTLTGLCDHDSRMDEAVNLVAAKQDDAGRWETENTYNSDRLLVPFTRENEPCKWITLRVMRVLKRYHQPPAPS